MTTAQKFSSVIDILSDAVDRQVTLDIEYPIIYNQVVKFYEEKGVDFYGDVDEDYAMEDFEYTKWLDPEGVPCYIRDVVTP